MIMNFSKIVVYFSDIYLAAIVAAIVAANSLVYYKCQVNAQYAVDVTR